MSDYLGFNAEIVFGPQFASELAALFQNSSETRRLFILGTVVLVATASVRFGHIVYEVRVATFAGAAGAEVTAVGLFTDRESSDGCPRLRCFHCDAVVAVYAGATSAECWAAHRLASPACYLAKLGQLVAAGGSVEAGDAADALVQSDARRYQTVLRRLRQLLDSPVVGAAASYGFDAVFLRLCAARNFMRNDCSVVDRPGDLLRLTQEVEELLLPTGGAARRIDLLRMLDGAMSGGTAVEAPQQQQLQPVPRASSAAAQQPPPPPTPIVGIVSADSPAGVEASPAEADDRCVQCRSRTRNRVTLPCAHFLLCDRCLESLGRCPKCNKTIVATITAFIT